MVGVGVEVDLLNSNATCSTFETGRVIIIAIICIHCTSWIFKQKHHRRNRARRWMKRRRDHSMRMRWSNRNHGRTTVSFLPASCGDGTDRHILLPYSYLFTIERHVLSAAALATPLALSVAMLLPSFAARRIIHPTSSPPIPTHLLHRSRRRNRRRSLRRRRSRSSNRRPSRSSVGVRDYGRHYVGRVAGCRRDGDARADCWRFPAFCGAVCGSCGWVCCGLDL